MLNIDIKIKDDYQKECLAKAVRKELSSWQYLKQFFSERDLNKVVVDGSFIQERINSYTDLLNAIYEKGQ